MQVPFDLSTLRKQIPAMDFSRPCPLGPEAQVYAAYYGLNLSDERPGVQHNLGYIQVLGGKVMVQTFVPAQANATVFIFHGYYDHAGLYVHLIKHVLDKGFAVLIYDLPGHGLSTGPKAAIDDFNDYLETLTVCIQLARHHLPSPWFAIAQSTGGAILMDYLLALPDNDLESVFDQHILLAPLFQPCQWQRGRLAYYLLRWFTQHVSRGYGSNSHDTAFIDFVRQRDPLQSRQLSVNWVGALNRWIKTMQARAPSSYSPTVIQGTEDTTVDAKINLAFIQNKFYRPDIYYLPGARHHLVNESLVYRQKMFDIIDAKLLAQ